MKKKKTRVQGEVRERVRATLEIEGDLQEGRVQHRNVNCSFAYLYNLPCVGPITK